jgi:broad specificity phosphatase PhoE
MNLYLVRHARAGSRQRWTKDDALRPLSRVGRAQADGIARRLAREPIEQIFPSPFARCVGTVEPLATKCGVSVELTDALAEGAPAADALSLVEKSLGRETVLCTHGDVIRDLLDHFGRRGVKLRDHRMEKGSIWVFEVVDGEVRRARYVSPPKTR